MKMKRKCAVLLAVIMLMAMIASACGGDSGNSEGTNTPGEGSAANDGQAEGGQGETPAGDPEHIIVTYLYGTTEPIDLGKVQDAVNAKTIPDINVEVEFKPLSIGDAFSNLSLWISSGEVMDLMMPAFQDIKANYVNSGQILPLDEYISEETTPTICQLMEEFPITLTVDDEIYSLGTVNVNYGNQAGLIMRKDYLDEINIEEKKVYSYDEITEIFAAIKANHSDCYPLGGLLGSSVITGDSLYVYFGEKDNLGGNVFAGVLMDESSETVVNLFETEEYKAWLAQMAQWHKDGYILPDAPTTDTSSQELMNSGKASGYAMMQKPEQFQATTYSFELAGLPLVDHSYVGAVTGGGWCVPITSKNPQAAVKFLDYLYSSSDLLNLIMFGMEGEHWEMADESLGLIKYPDGMEAETHPYNNTLGLWGDRRGEYTFSASATRDVHDAFTKDAMSHKFKSYGFNFDNSNVQNQLMACQSAFDQYQKALETGSLEDNWEATYNEMISQLKTAGIDSIIEECQKQFDAYLGK